MTMMSDFNRSRWRNILLAVTAMFATAGAALPQSTNVAKPFSDEGEYSTWDMSVFFGTQWFQMYQGHVNQVYQLTTKPIFGIRSSQDFGRYFGIEEGVGFGFNQLALLPYRGNAYTIVGQRDTQISVLGLIYMTPRTARFRPYVDFGPAGVVYNPLANGLRAKIVPGAIYGIGVKMPVTHSISVSVDLRGMWTPTPDFGLPGAPTGPGSYYLPI